MAAYRKGLVLTFGVINVIVSVEGMKDKESSLTSVCCGPAGSEHAPTKISQRLHCITCGGTVAFSDLKKAQAVGDSFVVVDQHEVAVVRDSVLGATKKMLNLTVHPASEVSANTLQGESVYLITPEGAPQIGAYSLLLDTVARHGEDYAFLTQWTPTSKASLYQLKVFNGGLVMQQLCWPEQVRGVPDLHVIEALPEHQTMLDTLLPTLSKPFVAEEYQNAYGRELAALIASKEAVAGVTPEATKSGPKPAATTGGVDLTAALAAMMQTAPKEETA